MAACLAKVRYEITSGHGQRSAGASRASLQMVNAGLTGCTAYVLGSAGFRCGRVHRMLEGWGCQNLWSDFLSDRWSWFAHKVFEFSERKTPLEATITHDRSAVRPEKWLRECPLLRKQRTLKIRSLRRAFDPHRHWPRSEGPL